MSISNSSSNVVGKDVLLSNYAAPSASDNIERDHNTYWEAPFRNNSNVPEPTVQEVFADSLKKLESIFLGKDLDPSLIDNFVSTNKVEGVLSIDEIIALAHNIVYNKSQYIKEITASLTEMLVQPIVSVRGSVLQYFKMYSSEMNPAVDKYKEIATPFRREYNARKSVIDGITKKFNTFLNRRYPTMWENRTDSRVQKVYNQYKELSASSSEESIVEFQRAAIALKYELSNEEIDTTFQSNQEMLFRNRKHNNFKYTLGHPKDATYWKDTRIQMQTHIDDVSDLPSTSRVYTTFDIDDVEMGKKSTRTSRLNRIYSKYQSWKVNRPHMGSFKMPSIKSFGNLDADPALAELHEAGTFASFQSTNAIHNKMFPRKEVTLPLIDHDTNALLEAMELEEIMNLSVDNAETYFKQQLPDVARQLVDNWLEYMKITLNRKAALILLQQITDDAKRKSFLEDIGKKGITLPGSNYIGPGNSLFAGEVRSNVDAIAWAHDWRYHFAKIQNDISTADRLAIEEFTNAYYSGKNWQALAGILGLEAKSIAETLIGATIYPGHLPKTVSSSSSLTRYACPSK